MATAGATGAATAAAVAADGLLGLIHDSRTTSGIRVVTDRMPEVRSVTVGAYVAIGARDEPDDRLGASHFLEHLLFKGSAKMSAPELARAVDASGGEMNAFTAREHTAYWLRLPAERLAFGLDVLGDILCAPALRAVDVEAERQVILEELAQSEDDPEDRVHSLCFEALFPDHPLGREVLGTPSSIDAQSPEGVADFHAAHYRVPNVVVVAAGDVDHGQVEAMVDRWPLPGAAGAAPARVAPVVPPRPVALLRRPTEQAHLALGWRAFSVTDPDRYALAVVDHVLGSGMSSRLFHEIRHLRGLAYSVYSYTSLHADAGALVVYVGCSHRHLAQVRSVLDAELRRLRADGITPEELAVAQSYLSGSLVLGLEDSASRMGRLGSELMARGEVTSVDDHLAAIEAVGLGDVARVVDRVFAAAPTVTAVGALDEADLA